MAFTVGDFHDLVRLLEQHPEWRAELRRLVLTEDELGLSAALRQLAEAQARTEEALVRLAERLDGHIARTDERFDRVDERFDQIDQRFGRVDERFDQIDQRFGRVDERFDQIDARLGHMDERFDRVDERLDRAETSIGRLLGSDVERRYRERAGAYFGSVVRRPRSLSAQQVADLLDGPDGDDRLTGEERGEVLLADVVVRGRGDVGDGDVYVVVEVSVTIDPHDVERASRRAAILGRLYTTIAAVAGESITPDAEVLARARGVWRILDGRATPPEVRAG